MVSGTAAREAALGILRGVRAGRQFDAAQAVAVGDLSDPDRRLAHEIAAGVLRARTELDDRLRPLLAGKWSNMDPDLRDVLRIGAYQLTRLDRIPGYAAVQATVEVAKRAAGVRSARLANAVLRRVAESDVAPADGPKPQTAAELADRYSHPAWPVERWVRRFGFERTGALLRHNNRRPRLTIQPQRWSTDRLRKRIVERGIVCSEAPFGKGLVIEGERAENLPGYCEGAFIVQDAAQARLLEHAAVPEGALVWDACASPGGKAAALSRRGPVIATELRRDRLARLQDTLSRVAAEVPVLVADARHPPLSAPRVDVTLVDAPCSATGTLARHPEGRWRLSEKGLKTAVKRQEELLEGTCETVRPGALLVYLTCSLEPEENDEQVDAFLESHADFERTCEDLFLFPADRGTDGGFASRLRRIP